MVANIDASKGNMQVREMFEGMLVTVTLDANTDVADRHHSPAAIAVWDGHER